MKESLVITAKCCCNKSSISVHYPPTTNALCHCSNCRARTGSAFGWSAYFLDEDIVSIAGPLKTYRIAEPNAQTRNFCSECGTTLFWTSDFAKGKTGVAGGCFNDLPMIEPTASYADNLRVKWLGLPEKWDYHNLDV